jgi:glutamate/tyrosine decarboxylase-like PLP-dependent enzyme
MDDRIAALDEAHRLALGFLSELDERPIWPRADYAELLAAFDRPLQDERAEPVAVVRELARVIDPGLNAMPSGRFFGFVIGGGLPAALAADWLTATWDQNAALITATPGTAACEEIAGRWVVDLLGLPPDASVGFVTGAMMATFSGPAAARHRVLAERGWDVNLRGLAGAPAIRVLVGEHRHSTVDRGLALLGLGREQIEVVDADPAGRIEADDLVARLDRHPRAPTIVVLQAGEVHTGAFDDFITTIPAAHARGAWVHVDGAFGLWAQASPATRQLTAGVAAADSWSTDGHKTLNVPYDCGISIVRDLSAAAAAYQVGGDYIIQSGVDPLLKVPEFSRRARGVPVWAALRSLGRQGVSELVAHLAHIARAFAEGLDAIEGIHVLNEVAFTQVLFAGDDDAETSAIGTSLLAEGTTAFTPARWQGRVVQRCSVSNWSTTVDDVRRAVDAVARVTAGLRER